MYKLSFYRFNFLKYAKFPFLYTTRFCSQIYLRKEETLFWTSVFQIEKKCELPKGKRKTESWECDWDYSNLGILRALIVPYISLSKKRCSKVIIFHFFLRVNDFVEVLETRTVSVSTRCWICVSYFVTVCPFSGVWKIPQG